MRQDAVCRLYLTLETRAPGRGRAAHFLLRAQSMKPIHGIPTSVVVVVSALVLLHAAALAWWLKKAVEKPQKGWGTLEGKKKT